MSNGGRRSLADEPLVTAFDDRFGETRESIETGEQAIANTEIERQEYNAMIGNSQALRAERDEARELAWPQKPICFVRRKRLWKFFKN